MKPKFLLGLTTTPGSDYLAKIEEIKKFNLAEIAFFPTGINQEKRKRVYALLEQTPLQRIPHVHLRDDFETWELEYLGKRYKTQVYNIHHNQDAHPFTGFEKSLGRYLRQTYLENTELIPEKEQLKIFGGLCIDFSHWEDALLLDYSGYAEGMRNLTKKFTIGCSHISAVGKTVITHQDLVHADIIYKNYSNHTFINLSEFDYIKKYRDWLPALVSLELENSFEEQLKAKEYLERIIESA